MRERWFSRYAWSVLGYNLLVIVWGAFVRASGSGAGCGSHWPTCNGDVIPQAPALATVIEFSHRLSSGLSLLLVVGLLAWALRSYPRRHIVRLGAWLSLAFIISEALVGAGLVIFGLTDKNDSVARAVVISIHLINTFLLVAALALTAWWSDGGARPRLRGQGGIGALLWVAIAGTLGLGITGAITALGDTLFPSASLAAGLAQDASPTAHFLIRLRVIHPLLAMTLGLYIVIVAAVVYGARPGPATRRWAAALGGLFLAQLMVGGLNVILLAPVAMQLIHLLMADLVWIALVLLAAAAFGAAPAAVDEREPRREPLPGTPA